jgi:hypothetical protein
VPGPRPPKPLESPGEMATGGFSLTLLRHLTRLGVGNRPEASKLVVSRGLCAATTWASLITASPAGLLGEDSSPSMELLKSGLRRCYPQDIAPYKCAHHSFKTPGQGEGGGEIEKHHERNRQAVVFPAPVRPKLGARRPKDPYGGPVGWHGHDVSPWEWCDAGETERTSQGICRGLSLRNSGDSRSARGKGFALECRVPVIP